MSPQDNENEQYRKQGGFMRKIIWKTTHLTSEKEEVEHANEVKTKQT